MQNHTIKQNNQSHAFITDVLFDTSSFPLYTASLKHKQNEKSSNPPYTRVLTKRTITRYVKLSSDGDDQLSQNRL